jgi:hypothetical protein
MPRLFGQTETNGLLLENRIIASATWEDLAAKGREPTWTWLLPSKSSPVSIVLWSTLRTRSPGRHCVGSGCIVVHY